jgi:hypothetical protein
MEEKNDQKAKVETSPEELMRRLKIAAVKERENQQRRLSEERVKLWKSERFETTNFQEIKPKQNSQQFLEIPYDLGEDSRG